MLGDGASRQIEGITVLEDTESPDRSFTDEEVREYAEYLGIDWDTEPHLVWVAREGIASQVPAPWKACTQNKTDIFYFNFESGESTWDHPCDVKYRKMVETERDKFEVQAKADTERRAAAKASEHEGRTADAAESESDSASVASEGESSRPSSARVASAMGKAAILVNRILELSQEAPDSQLEENAAEASASCNSEASQSLLGARSGLQGASRQEDQGDSADLRAGEALAFSASAEPEREAFKLSGAAAAAGQAQAVEPLVAVDLDRKVRLEARMDSLIRTLDMMRDIRSEQEQRIRILSAAAA